MLTRRTPQAQELTVMLTYLEMCLSAETGDAAVVTRWVNLPLYSVAVLRGDGLVAGDVIVVILVGEVQEKIIGTRRLD